MIIILLVVVTSFAGGFGLGTDGIFNPVGSLMSGNQFSVSIPARVLGIFSVMSTGYTSVQVSFTGIASIKVALPVSVSIKVSLLLSAIIKVS